MKKLFACLLALTMALAGLAGCGAQAPAETITEASAPAETAASQKQISVSSVDELLAALASDVCITLAPGTYDLTAASDYGQESTNPAYIWEPCYDGYELQLRDLHDLTIQADNKDTTSLTTVPRTVNVLLLDRCSQIQLKGLTVGHTESGEMCNGGVLRLVDCTDVELQKMGLYGCGTIGVDVSGMENLTVSDCEIYDCSYAGIRTFNLNGMAVENCRFHDIGAQDQQAGSVLQLEASKNVTVTGAAIQNNILQTLLDFNNAEAQIRDCEIVDNRMVMAGFSLFGSHAVWENNNLVSNDLRTWYVDGSDSALDPNGEPITAEKLPAVNQRVPEASDGSAAAGMTVSENPDLPQREQIHVATVDEFLAALGSNREIILGSELYDLSLAAGYGQDSTDVYSWSEEFDGPELVITGVSNLVITSADGVREGHTISATPRYADVLTFRRCENIELSGFTAGHTKEPGSCAGGVVYFDDCDHITVDNCGLFGCGIIGVQAQYCGDVQVLNCDIYDCSVGGIRMDDVQGAVIDNCTLRNLEFYDINLQNCPDALVNGKPYEPGF